MWNAINRISVLWKSHLSNKIKCGFLQAVAMFIQRYRCTTRTLTKCIEKKAFWELQENAARCLDQILEATPYKTTDVWSLTSHLRNNRYVGHCWKSKAELISIATLWTLAHRRTSVSRPEKIHLHRIQDAVLKTCQESMDYLNGWRERTRKPHAVIMRYLWWKWRGAGIMKSSYKKYTVLENFFDFKSGRGRIYLWTIL